MDKNIIIDQIISFFVKAGKFLKLNEINKHLGIKSDTAEYQKVKALLNDLCEQKILQKSNRRRYSLLDYDDSQIIKGVLKIKDNRGIVETDSQKYPKIFIKTKHMFSAFDGDTVQIKLIGERKGSKIRAEVIKILKRAEHNVSGIIEFDANFYFLIPDDDKYYIDFLIHKNKLNGAKSGDKVVARMVEWDDAHKSPQAEVLQIRSRTAKKTAEQDSIIDELFLPKEFNKEVISFAENINTTIDKNLLKSRIDLRNEDIITIDPVDAKDFDDALSLTILPNGNYYLGVHIADVSYYVQENSIIDEEAKWRGNSIYLVDRVIPMLPESLSNEICSLKPQRLRLAFSVFMEFTTKGFLKDYEIKESVIKSKQRFNYDEVQQIIETKKGDYSDLILNLHQLASILRKNRYAKGGVEFETFEIKFVLDENKVPINSIIKTSTDSTNLVEECMLAANQAVASHVTKLSNSYKLKEILPFIYRVHDLPVVGKLHDVLQFIKSFKKTVKTPTSSSKDINNLLKVFKDTPEKPIVHQVLLRAMSKAEYSSKNIGHYGLGFKEYTHFTSPIRRYPDLIVHRLIKEYQKAKPKSERIKFLQADLIDISNHTTEREHLAMEAERASVKLTQAVFASGHVGKEYTGTISGVMSMGMFVLMDEILAEGLVHVRDMHDDYYYFDERNFKFIGKRHKKEFGMGKRIKVKINSVDIEKRRIDLKYLGSV